MDIIKGQIQLSETEQKLLENRVEQGMLLSTVERLCSIAFHTGVQRARTPGDEYYPDNSGE